MSVRAHRSLASLCIALLALSQARCTHIKEEEAAVLQSAGSEAALRKVVGVTLKDGRDIRFDPKSLAFVRGDSLQAQVGKEPLAIPVADVQRVWLKSVDNTRTSFLVSGLLIVALTAFAAIGASQISY
ncbi:MAG TPA: hypothetical protein VD771_10430 [Gemmatimonadaceae bacterium]|nr:hypothetical protein [Gemmatimonadaceae bacterium]